MNKEEKIQELLLKIKETQKQLYYLKEELYEIEPDYLNKNYPLKKEGCKTMARCT
jgi:hypothetical protein